MINRLGIAPATAVAALILASGAQAAPVVIDDLSTSQNLGAFLTNQTNGSSVSNAGAILGTERDMHILVTNSASNNGFDRSTLAAGGSGGSTLRIGNDPGQTSTSTVTYDGIDGNSTPLVVGGGFSGTGLAASGVDLVNGTNNAISLDVVSIDTGTVDIQVEVWDALRSARVTLSNIDFNSDGEQLNFFFDQFVDSGIGVNFEEVKAIQLRIIGNGQDIDATFDFFGATTVVPVPAGLPLLLTALGAFGFLRWRQSRSV